MYVEFETNFSHSMSLKILVMQKCKLSIFFMWYLSYSSCIGIIVIF